ncbi:hypothetical protein BJ165DRAFT_1436047 [Panaeolus papilionaceus]|nr:hypothetical protein BJ165DRAFT_1436047 [Panaeolus papilionaceus]
MSRIITFIIYMAFLGIIASASVTPQILPRTEPYFPDTPTSCPICAKDYPSISSCAQAAPVMANFSMIIFNPGAFIDVIKCACVDTFQAAFPQCVDCFIQTGQQDVLNTPDLPAVVDGMRKICGLGGALLGNVSAANGYPTPSPSPTPSTALSTHNPTIAMALCLASLIGVLGFFMF